MNLKQIVTALGVIAVLFVFAMFFAPIHDMSLDMTTTYIIPATSDDTPIVTDNGTMPVFNDFKAGVGGGYFWIIAACIVIGGVIAIAMEANKGDNS
jgi:hypothetical protein